LEELGTWLAACQGVCPPRPIERARIVVFAGDHGVAARGVSAYPSEVTGQMVANFRAGGAAINVLAAAAGATVRVVDVSVDSPATDEYKVRRSSGPIDCEDALTQDEVEAALAAGRSIVDEEVDAGADLLVAGDMGIGNTTSAAVLVAALTGAEPVTVVGRGTGIDDATWMRKTAAIRDALRRAKPVTAEPVALLRTVGGADIAAMAGFLAQAAIRRTPVILDGVVSGAAALVAEELAPGARAWWVAGHRSTEPSHTLVLDQLDLEPLLELKMRLGEGSGATAALPLVLMAGRILSEMATFADAGISGPADKQATDPATDAESATAGPTPAAATESTPQPEHSTGPTPAAAPDSGGGPEPSADPTATATPTPAAAPAPSAEPQTSTGPSTNTKSGALPTPAGGPESAAEPGAGPSTDAKSGVGSAPAPEGAAPEPGAGLELDATPTDD
jgi:nicotinate-nucleotide--dimethylbenzimidazole phosphoribosyltransferase